MTEHRSSAADNSRVNKFLLTSDGAQIMELPLFPLKDVVLFPGMVLPLHIFEPRYREMINYCVAEKLPFGVVLIDKGDEVGKTAVPHMVGTAARIARVERHENGTMDLISVGIQRFRIQELVHTHSYLSAIVRQYPVVNGDTKEALDLMQKVRPRIVEYVDLLARASNTPLRLDRLPEDPTTLAFLVAITLQVSSQDKQKVLEMAGVPEILKREAYLLSREKLFVEYMTKTQVEVSRMNMGPTGYIFPN